MAKYDGALIEILGWEKYNPRSNSKRPSWFRFDHLFFSNQTFCEFTQLERLAVVFLWCQASQKNSKTILVKYSFITKQSGIAGSVIESCLRKLLQEQCVCVVSESFSKKLEETSRNFFDPLPTEITEITEITESGNGTRPLPPLAELWNKHRGQLAEVKGCTGKRLESANARWDEKPETEYWSEIVSRMARSAFCRGEKQQPGPHSSWKADFDFLIRPDTQHKVLEGKYDDRKSGAPVMSLEKKKQLEECDRQLAAAGVKL